MEYDNRKQLFRRETKRGFTISEVMKRSWAADIKILNEVLDICKQIDVKLFACYGTLLGAVREHGYIPWDDDLDMGLVGDDYVRFIDVIANDYGDRFSIFNPYTRTWFKMNFSHMVNRSEVSFNRKYLDEWCGCPFMTGLDIYPYYYIPRNKDDEEYILNALGKIDNAIALSRQAEVSGVENKRSDRTKEIRESLAYVLVELQHLTGCSFSTDRPLDNQLEILYDQVCRIPDEKSSDYVARYDEYVKNKNRKHPKEYLNNIVYIPFEYTCMPCPIGYNDVLIKRFGEGFIIPRQEKGAHDYPYYKKQLNDRDYYEELIRRGTKIDISTVNGTKDIDDPEFKKQIKRKLYHTSAYEMLIHSDNAISTIKDTLTELITNKDNAELWWMPDMFLRSEDYAMDMVAPDLIEEYEALIQQFAENGIRLLNVTDKYNKLTGCFDEYYGDSGIVSEEFLKAHKKVVLHDYLGPYIENTTPDLSKNKGKIYNMPDVWKKIIERRDGTKKKVILYVVGRSVLFQYREKILDKIESVLKVFYNNRDDIALIWKPYVMEEQDREVFGESFVGKMNNLLEEYKVQGWGILDISDCSEESINIADAVYGDSDYIIARCLEKGMPVMIQNPDII